MAGCLSYVPTELDQVKPHEKIRIGVDAAQLGRLAAYADGARGTVEGEFLGVAGDSVRLVLRTPASYREVGVPLNAVRHVRLRRVDNTKSFVLSAVAVAGVGYLAWQGFSGGGNRGTGNEGVVDESLIPLYSFRLPGGLNLVLGGR